MSEMSYVNNRQKGHYLWPDLIWYSILDIHFHSYADHLSILEVPSHEVINACSIMLEKRITLLFPSRPITMDLYPWEVDFLECCEKKKTFEFCFGGKNFCVAHKKGISPAFALRHSSQTEVYGFAQVRHSFGFFNILSRSLSPTNFLDTGDDEFIDYWWNPRKTFLGPLLNFRPLTIR